MNKGSNKAFRKWLKEKAYGSELKNKKWLAHYEKKKQQLIDLLKWVEQNRELIDQQPIGKELQAEADSHGILLHRTGDVVWLRKLKEADWLTMVRYNFGVFDFVLTIVDLRGDIEQCERDMKYHKKAMEKYDAADGNDSIAVVEEICRLITTLDADTYDAVEKMQIRTLRDKWEEMKRKEERGNC